MEHEWRKGFPRHTLGLAGYYLFEVLISDLLENNKVVEAYIKDGLWYKDGEGKNPLEEVVGWRETYDCRTARIAIDEYVRKCGFGISKHNFGDALSRHIQMDSYEFISCEECWNYYLEKSGEKDKRPTPEKLLEIKQIVMSN